MQRLSDAVSLSQPAYFLHCPESLGEMAPYRDALGEAGLKIQSISTMDCAPHILVQGGRAGLLLVTEKRDLPQLQKWQSELASTRTFWVGLIDEAIIDDTDVRDFIADYLFNFITLPADTSDILNTLRHAWQMALMHELRRTPGAQEATQEKDALLGHSAPIMQLCQRIQKVARTDAPVLITGPSGSGKETVALSIHRHSARAAHPFLSINCASLPPPRLHQELYGIDGTQGLIHQAHLGTLFLDAAGDLNMEAQANLLHFLGDTSNNPVDVRIIAASNTDLSQAVRLGRFREDLFYRLDVMSIATPHLCDCGEDVELLARHYLDKFSQIHNRSIRGYSKSAMEAILVHPWPGNVRELINRIQRAAVMTEGRFIQPEDLGLERPLDLTESLSLEDARAAAERLTIRRALTQSRNQISRAATLLGVSRVTLYRLIEKYNIRQDISSIEAVNTPGQ